MESLFIQLSYDVMYKSQFRKMYPYDWFCGPGSHTPHTHIYIYTVLSVNEYTPFEK